MVVVVAVNCGCVFGAEELVGVGGVLGYVVGVVVGVV